MWQAFLTTIHFFKVFANMQSGKLEYICICSILLNIDLAIIIINIFSIQSIIISLWQIHIDQQLDKMQHHLGDKFLAMSTRDYWIITRIIKVERPIFILDDCVPCSRDCIRRQKKKKKDEHRNSSLSASRTGSPTALRSCHHYLSAINHCALELWAKVTSS